MRFFHVIALWLLAILPASAALEVRNPRWGFGGKVTLGTFNVLSLELVNRSGKIFDGTVKLKMARSDGSAAAFHQQVSLAPGQTRFVQFTPYIASYKPTFVVSWGDDKEDSFTLEDRSGEVSSAPPAVVVLSDPTAVRQSKFPVFPEDLFPTSVSATDGLHSVLLDHAPRFGGPARTEAFLDWVRLGGIVHLLPGPSGALPTFEGDLAALNIPGNKGRLGSGYILKHTFPIADATPAALEKAGFPAPGPDTKSYDSDDYNNRRYRGYDSEGYNDTSFFSAMGAVTRPNIAWWLIYLLTGVYVIIIGPVFFFLRKRDYRLLLLGFVGTVVLFSWVFTVIGKRGYGEKQVCHSLAIARVIGPGRFDVIHWSHAFATSGDTYRLAYPGSSHMYSAIGGESDTVRGYVELGKDAFFSADIPLFSSRNFIHRGVMTGDDVTKRVLEFPVIDPAVSASNWKGAFKVELNIPGNEIISATLQHGNSFFRTSIDGSLVSVKSFYSSGDTDTLNPADGRGERYFSSYGRMDAEYALRMLRSSGSALAKRAYASPDNLKRAFGRPVPPNTLRMYVYAQAPGKFRLAGDEFASGKNFVLYIQDFPVQPINAPLESPAPGQ